MGGAPGEVLRVGSWQLLQPEPGRSEAGRALDATFADSSDETSA